VIGEVDAGVVSSVVQAGYVKCATGWLALAGHRPE